MTRHGEVETVLRVHGFGRDLVWKHAGDTGKLTEGFTMETGTTTIGDKKRATRRQLRHDRDNENAMRERKRERERGTATRHLYHLTNDVDEVQAQEFPRVAANQAPGGGNGIGELGERQRGRVEAKLGERSARESGEGVIG